MISLTSPIRIATTENVFDTAGRRKRKRDVSTLNNAPVGPHGGVYFNRRRNGRLVKHVVLPKILKHDIRRDYAAMFRNVYNSCDQKLMNQYLFQFCRPDSIFQEKFCVQMNDVMLHTRSDGTSLVSFSFKISNTCAVPVEVVEAAVPAQRFGQSMGNVSDGDDAGDDSSLSDLLALLEDVHSCPHEIDGDIRHYDIHASELLRCSSIENCCFFQKGYTQCDDSDS
eukprot:gene11206-12498_t